MEESNPKLVISGTQIHFVSLLVFPDQTLILHSNRSADVFLVQMQGQYSVSISILHKTIK